MAADALEQSVLEAKDREQLVAIASALDVKFTSRAKKSDLIQKILEQTGAIPVSNGAAPNAPTVAEVATPIASTSPEQRPGDGAARRPARVGRVTSGRLAQLASALP